MAQEQAYLKEEIKTLTISSPVFNNLKLIPSKYTCEGENVNPPINISKLPKETKSLILMIEDSDTPIRPWLHWLVWNIPATTKIKENYIPGIEARNDFGRQSYGGPCPPVGIHHYHFKIYALNKLIYVEPPVNKKKIEKAMAPHIIGFGELTGVYKKQNNVHDF